jgi:predicted O-methyltransferase YrrM
VKRALGIAQAALRDPYEAYERTRERLGEWRDEHGGNAQQLPVSPDWEERAHHAFGCPWPCDAHAEFEALYHEIITSLQARGLQTGRDAYGGWDDGDAALARIAWCATLHTKPGDVVETGVARGITSRCVLEAMERNGSGRLWSIDIPPLIESQLRSETGAAIPDRLRDRWRYIEGSSRKRLPEVVDVLGRVDMFVHDSMHTTRNVGFELARVWPVLRESGVAIIDDVEQNSALATFAQAHPDSFFVTGNADDAHATVGVALKAR